MVSDEPQGFIDDCPRITGLRGQLAKSVENLLNVGRQWGFELTDFSAAWVVEGQPSGVKGSAVKLIEDLEGLFAAFRRASGAAVIGVPHHRESGLGKMNSDLMGAAGRNANRQKAGERKHFQSLRFRDGGFWTSRAARDPLAVVGIAPNGTFHQQTVGGRTVDECQIEFLDASRGKLACQRAMGIVVFGCNE